MIQLSDEVAEAVKKMQVALAERLGFVPDENQTILFCIKHVKITAANPPGKSAEKHTDG